MNAKFTISYDGTKFQGSQTQPNGLSVEDRLQEAFKSINIDTKIVLSGRTDKDVHATGQVFNAFLPSFWNDLKKLKKILNKHLPNSINIKTIQEVEKDFHSRFHAKKRVYRYLVSTNKPTVFNADYISYHEKIDEAKIKEAIKLFEGVHDFEYFHKKGSDKENTVREVFSTKFYKYKDIYVFHFCANSYLRSQIRLMVGILLKISDGKLSLEDLKKQLEKKQNKFRTPASPYGLYLAKVYY
ncbi:tRNA pseudouridine(38-40) synthase TruA [Halarcobacter bivalviorum]|uniref:tRNA pseudouridine synthase A n=1 Tax=Halarcobacter bivalviorum TaxID=663364 RepID=A0AAX2AB66_9BACT|nr:tRNA pseudouridine(38-40) synthase TruA [Halarcobacter bivalviorum]AXH13430.1 tRNA pseudouridine(38-40) synthase [Halarcobacter bivalviorum]RXK09971.1 tRNA pseudouridine(38-40) synthase TruA [Halarcobacter bivalviorum]